MYKKLEIFLGIPYPAGSVKTAVQRFLQDREAEVSTASLVHLYRTLSQHGDLLDNPQLSEVTPRTLTSYVDDLRTRYSPGTIRPIVGDLKQFYSWLHNEGLTESNYGRRLKKPKPVKEKHHADESDMLVTVQFLAKRLDGMLYYDLFGNLRAVDEGWHYDRLKTLHDLAAVSFLYETGCRAGELCNLSSRYITKTVSRPQEVYGITCYGKTNDRSYRFTNTTAELCRLWYEKRPFASTWVFCSWRRGFEPAKLETPALSQMIARRCRQAGVRPFRAHAIRHSKVIRSRKIVGLEIASKLIDHSSIATTREYDYIDDRELEKAAVLTGLRPHLW
jgi:integrase